MVSTACCVSYVYSLMPCLGFHCAFKRNMVLSSQPTSHYRTVVTNCFCETKWSLCHKLPPPNCTCHMLDSFFSYYLLCLPQQPYPIQPGSHRSSLLKWATGLFLPPHQLLGAHSRSPERFRQQKYTFSSKMATSVLCLMSSDKDILPLFRRLQNKEPRWEDILF